MTGGGSRTIVVDAGLGNIRSLLGGLAQLGVSAIRSACADDIRGATHVILPGVGSFPHAMSQLILLGLVDPLLERCEEQRPVLGICIGAQVLLSQGLEGSPTPGLGVLPGVVRQLAPADALAHPLPHTGWAYVTSIGATDPGVRTQETCYFNHGYVMDLAEPNHIRATSWYGERFCALARDRSIWGMQFHPEKSQSSGQRFLTAFLQS